MASGLYNKALYRMGSGSLNLGTVSLKCALLGAAYTLDKSNHNVWADISANEISGTGYTAGGANIAGQTVTEDESTGKMKFDADNVQWTNATISNARYAIIYESTGGYLVACIDFGANQSCTNGTFTITFDSNGVFDLAG